MEVNVKRYGEFLVQNVRNERILVGCYTRPSGLEGTLWVCNQMKHRFKALYEGPAEVFYNNRWYAACILSNVTEQDIKKAFAND